MAVPQRVLDIMRSGDVYLCDDEEMLDAHGYHGQYEITQCTVAEATPKSVNFDMLTATTMAPKGLQCPYVNGVCYLTGVGVDKANQEILELMEK